MTDSDQHAPAPRLPPEAFPQSRLRPANDPKRPCWAFFKIVLGRPLEVPADPARADGLLQELYGEACASQPRRMIAFALIGPAWTTKLAALAAALGAEGIGGGADLHLVSRLGSAPGWRPDTTSIVEYLRGQALRLLCDYYDRRYRSESLARAVEVDPRLERAAANLLREPDGVNVR